MARYTREIRALNQQLTDAHNTYADYLMEIAGGSTSGFGHYIQQGTGLITTLNEHYSRTNQKRQIHRTLSFDQTKDVYDAYVASHDLAGIPHPQNHPLTNPTSKTELIEALTEDYGYEPADLIDTHHALINVP
jgi:hypothetical protein